MKILAIVCLLGVWAFTNAQRYIQSDTGPVIHEFAIDASLTAERSAPAMTCFRPSLICLVLRFRLTTLSTGRTER